MAAGLERGDLKALAATFGKDEVAARDRRALVRDLFNRVAPRYDLMNDLMSFGLHRLWKRKTAAIVAAAAEAVDGPLVDLAGGTGDIAALVSARLPGRDLINIDASTGMIAAAARRALPRVALAVAEAEHLPLAEGTIAAISLGFGLRNMTDPQGALREAHRVLKPGAALIVLEFSRPYRWFAPFYAVYSRYVIPALGALVASDRRAYRYLVESIERFPDAETMTDELRKAGFANITVRRVMFGVAAIHVAVKP